MRRSFLLLAEKVNTWADVEKPVPQRLPLAR